MQTLRQSALAFGILAIAVALGGIAFQSAAVWQPAMVAAAVALAVGVGALTEFRTYQFTMWILAGVVGAMIYPSHFLQVGPIDLRNKTLILVMMQLVMFGMGTQMSIRDMAGVLRMPYPVIVGIALQFTIMPLVGFALASTLGFSPEVAAGIVLIGSCSSGLASNVMTFIAKANLPLSITLTSLATMLAPIMTPMWMKVLAGRMIPIDALAMMMEIIKLIMVPIAAALLSDYLGHASARGRRAVYALAVASAAVLSLAFLARGNYLGGVTMATDSNVVTIIGFTMGAVIVGVVYHGLQRMWPAVSRVMPVLSMIGIVYVTSITIAAGRDRLLVIGPLLLVAVIAHNTLGYTLGYWCSRALRLDKKSARTVAIEVGLQNGGMATTIAAALNQLATLGLAAAVFNPWMNFSGSILANYWRRRPLADEELPPADKSVA